MRKEMIKPVLLTFGLRAFLHRENLPSGLKYPREFIKELIKKEIMRRSVIYQDIHLYPFSAL